MKKIVRLLLIAATLLALCVIYTKVQEKCKNKDPLQSSISENVSVKMPSSAVFSDNNETGVTELGSSAQAIISIRRIITSFIGPSGQNYGTMYYDLPVIIGAPDSANELTGVVRKINDVLLEAYTEFSTDSDFLERTEANIRMGKDIEPTRYEVASLVVYNSDDLFSIYQTMYWNIGGVNSFDDFGKVFNLATGEELQLSRFIEQDEYFNIIMSDFLYAELKDIYPLLSKEELATTYGQSNLDAYEFYYKDGDLYIIMKDKIREQPNVIIRWSVEENAPKEIVRSTSYELV